MKFSWSLCFYSMLAAAAFFTVSFSQTVAEEINHNVLSDEEKSLGFELLFDGKELSPEKWQGNVAGYPVKDRTFYCNKGGQIATKNEYDNFIFRFEFRLAGHGNNGVGIRSKLGDNPAFEGMEIQILSDSRTSAKPWQRHGSIYGIVPAKTGALKPDGQWNEEEITAIGSKIKVVVNGITVVDADIANLQPVDDQQHPGLHNKSGVVSFVGHYDPVAFRHVRIKRVE